LARADTKELVSESSDDDNVQDKKAD